MPIPCDIYLRTNDIKRHTSYAVNHYLPGDGGFRRGGGGLSLLRRRSAGRMADRSDDGTTPVALMVKSEVITSIKMFADRHLGHSSPSQIGSKLPILGQCDNAALPLVAPPRIADRRPFLATRPGFRSHYDIRLTAFYLSPKRCRHRRHRPRRRSPGDCMLSSLALRSFIFHPNQWLVLKAVRQAPARPAYTRRPRCTADIFCNLAWWRETYFRGLLVRPFRA